MVQAAPMLRLPSAGRRPGKRVRDIIVDSPNSVGARARAARWQLVQDNFPDLRSMSVLDLGGTVETWVRAPMLPRQVTVLNLVEPGTSHHEGMLALHGDACDATRVLAENRIPARFDLVFSNSLVEHVGGHARRTALAREIHALAPYHWVQTPYRYFPVEPHWLFPFMQFLPVAGRTLVAERWPLVHSKPESREAARDEVLWTELVGVSEMQTYFPESDILRERFAGLTKSIVAVKAPHPTV